MVWFVFLWWVVTLRGFSYTSWPFLCCFSGKKFFHVLCLCRFLIVFYSFGYGIVWVPNRFWMFGYLGILYQTYVWKYFLPFCGLPFNFSFSWQKLSLTQSLFCLFFGFVFVACAFVVKSKKSLSWPMSRRFPPMCFSWIQHLLILHVALIYFNSVDCEYYPVFLSPYIRWLFFSYCVLAPISGLVDCVFNVGENGKMLVKVTHFGYKMKSIEIRFNRLTIVNNTVSYIWNFLRGICLYVFTTNKKWYIMWYIN